MLCLRKAQHQDTLAIRRLIYQARINPLNLDWRHFIVAVDEAGSIIGVGQIKSHGDGTRELASIAVKPAHRGRGVASAIIRQLLVENELPLYLTCRASLDAFYERFGFRAVSVHEMTPYFKWVYRIAAFIKRFFPKIEELLVMIKTA